MDKNYSCAHICLLGLGVCILDNYFTYFYNVTLMIIFLPQGEVQRIRIFPRREWENSLSWL